MAANEERPPIIVRGGSLVIQSGDERSTKPVHKKGKPWRERSGDRKRWKQKHDNGKHVTTYSVSFQGGGGSCSPVHSSEVRIRYDLTTGDRVDVVIGRDKTDDSDDLEPLITSSRELTPDNEREQPTLTLPLDGRIVSITAGGNTCTNPVSAKLQPIGRTSDDRPPRRLFIFAAIALLALAGLVAFALGLFDFNGNEERPPIIVRNGSIVFENDLGTGPSTGQSKRWVHSGNKKWKPDHEKGKRISDFEVTFTGVQCEAMIGHPVRITRTNGAGATETYEIKREGIVRVDPKVVSPPNVDLTADNSIPKATLTSPDAGGAITEVRIAGNSCAIPAKSRPEITIKPR